MVSYSRIILPLDESETSEQALPYASALATGLSLPVRLLLAVEPDSPAITQSLYSNRRWIAPASDREARAEEYLSRISAGFRDHGIRVDSTIPHREPVAGIVEEAASDPNALIVMASHGRSGIARWWMGSVADKVLHMSNNPVLLVRAQEREWTTADGAFSHLIVPLDGSEMAELALPHIIHLATSIGLPVKLIQVTPSEAEYYRYVAAGPAAVPMTPPSSISISELVQMAGEEAQNYLEDAKNRLINQGVQSVETLVTQGNAADAIVDLATAEGVSLVGMTTHGRSGVGRMMLGSVAERVVRQSGCPVLVIRTRNDG